MKRFTLTAEHVTLLRNANVQWYGDEEWGAPRISDKRPYGNSDTDKDIARILGWTLFEDRHGETHLSADQFTQAITLHQEMGEALAVVLAAGTFEPGEYVTTQDFTNDWRPA